MSEPAKGNHPKGVSAVILTPEEAQAKKDEIARQQQAIAGSGPTAEVNATEATIPAVQHPAPGITVTQHIPNKAVQVPSKSIPVESTQPETESNLVFGKIAIHMAKKLELPYVWNLEGQPIDIEVAEEMILSAPNSVVFDIDRLMEVSEEIEDEQEELDITQEDGIDPFNATLPEPDELAIADEQQPIPEPPVQEVKTEHVITEREKRAWGGTLSSPGMQVYIHPKGIIRAQVEGPVLVQKGIQGNVRTFRITKKVTVGSTAQNVPAQPVTPPQTRSPNPNVTYSMKNPEKIKVPIPKPFEPEDEETY